jgi:hemerythrin-like domain-containing protein
MKRSPQLSPLSRDHHVALEHALRLRRASEDDAAAVVARFLTFFAVDGERHFAREEAILVPAIPAEAQAMRDRLLSEHAEIRRRAAQLGEAPAASPAAELGELLSSHVRFEERELFPLLEAALAPAALDDIAEQLDR